MKSSSTASAGRPVRHRAGPRRQGPDHHRHHHAALRPHHHAVLHRQGLEQTRPPQLAKQSVQIAQGSFASWPPEVLRYHIYDEQGNFYRTEFSDGQDCFRNVRIAGVPTFVVVLEVAGGKNTAVGITPFLISIPNPLAVSRLRLNSPTSIFSR